METDSQRLNIDNDETKLEKTKMIDSTEAPAEGDSEKQKEAKSEGSLAEETSDGKNNEQPSEEKGASQNDADGDVVMKDSEQISEETEKEEKKDDSGENNNEDQSSEAANGGDSTKAAPSSSESKETAETGGESESVPKNGTSEGAKDDAEETPSSETNGGSETNTTQATANAPKPAASSEPPPPVMRGTLSYNVETRKHLIRGMWNYENSTALSPQRFQLVRELGPEEDVTELPKDGEFHGTFGLSYFHTTSSGKQKERCRIIPEEGVNIKFTPIEGKPGEYTVNGKGTNQFGVFHLNGTAFPSTMEGDPDMRVEFRKRYEPQTAPAPAPDAFSESKKAKGSEANEGPLPPPAESFPQGVVCLRGKLYKEESRDIGGTEVTQKISGMWASGLNFILADPDNSRGLLCRFEYEHKSSAATGAQPVSGRYSGWFDLKQDDGTKTRINERDVTLKFRKNSAGYSNIEGKGSNVFGKYTITGTLTKDGVITIFRHFVPRKIKGNKAIAASALPTAAARRVSATSLPAEAKLKLEDVKIPGESSSGEPLDPVKPPETRTYSAVSRGVLRVNDDGSHSCAGKWAVTREHFTSGQTSNFNFRLEPHFATEAAAAIAGTGEDRAFPLDSNMYRGSFQLKKTAGRNQTIADQQVVMKFRMNKSGSYNVYGKGINAIGEFNLLGTLIMSGKTGGQVELYRMYPPERLTAPVAKPTGSTAPKAAAANGAQRLPGASPAGSLVRRESTRVTKLPSRLEDDDPSAKLVRVMEKCSQILRIMREKDVELGAFFSDPVDPVALGIPTYHQIIKEPMDLKTIHRRMEAGEVKTPDEFARLCRLVFENAITFNVDPAHAVHQSARALHVQFNTKFRDVEHMLSTIRRNMESEKKKDKPKQEEPKSAKRQRLDELQTTSSEFSRLMTAFHAATPASPEAPVTRQELGFLFQMIEQLQRTATQTLAAVAELSPGDENDSPADLDSAIAAFGGTVTAPAPAPRKKKAPKRKSEVLEEPTMIEDASPLTLDEQEILTETINDLPTESLGGIIAIIRESAPVGADEDEIDLEIDQLDARTQRKLFKYVQKVSE